MQVIENKENFSGSRLCVSATGSAFMDGFVLTSQGFIFLLAQSVFQFSALELGLVATAYVLGSFIGSMGFGKIADVYGRAVLFRTVPWFVAALSIAQFVNFSPLSWFISRFLFGLAIGGDSPIAQAMLSENSPKSLRAKRLVLLMTAWFIGAIAAAVCAYMTVKAGLAWEFFAAIPCVIGLILGVARFNAPESVQWLKSKGRIKQAEESRLRLGIEAEEAKHEVKAAHQAALFKPINLKNLAYLSVFWICQAIPVTVLLMFGPVLIGALGTSNFDTDVGQLVLTDSFFLIGSLAAIKIVPHFARRPVILWTFGIMAVSLALLSPGQVLTNFVVCLLLSIYALSYGVQSVLDYVYPAELFPTSIRSTALGILGSVSRVGVFVVTLGFPMAFEGLGVSSVLLIGAAISMFGFVISWLFAPEPSHH